MSFYQIKRILLGVLTVAVLSTSVSTVSAGGFLRRSAGQPRRSALPSAAYMGITNYQGPAYSGEEKYLPVKPSRWISPFRYGYWNNAYQQEFIGDDCSGCSVSCDPCISYCDPCFTVCDPCFDPCFSPARPAFRPIRDFLSCLKSHLFPGCSYYAAPYVGICDPCFTVCDPCFSCDPCCGYGFGQTVYGYNSGCGCEGTGNTYYPEENVSSESAVNSSDVQPLTPIETNGTNDNWQAPVGPVSPSVPQNAPQTDPNVPSNLPSPNSTDADLNLTTGVISIQVPENAVVYVNGYKTKMTGTLRNFVSSNLESGYVYDYTVRVEFNGLEETKTLSLSAGNTTSVAFDFNQVKRVETIASR